MHSVASALSVPSPCRPFPASQPVLPARLLLTSALLMALSACGGGGSNVRPDAPPAPGGTGTTPTPAPAPAPQDTPSPYQPPAYHGPQDNLVLPTGVDLAHHAGLDGQGVTVGMLDAGYLGESAHRPSAGLQTHYQDFTSNQSPDDPSVVNFQHGHYVASTLAGASSGNADGEFQGGVAPGVDLYWGRICQKGSCTASATRKALDNWMAQGVALDVLNLSLSSPRSQSTVTQQAAIAWNTAFAPLATADTLVVVSTGNHAFDEPGLPAALPVYYPQWSDRWLAVGSVQVNVDGQLGSLSSYSNACGDAADWCLVAPGAQYVGAMADPAQGNGWVSGTSISAPVVSGVAALVKQAHPWMSASNLQQTLLTTATDLGEPGVDAIYGWGAVDAARAMRGPAQINGLFQADIANGQGSALSNDISGNGRLEKTGEGRLVLAGTNTFSGGVAIGGGTLGLVGDLASDMLLSRGRLEVLGGSIGGNFSAAPGTVTSVAIGDPLQVAGTADLDGELHLRAIVDGYSPTSNEPLLQADAINGQFAAVTVGSGLFYSATLSYDDHQVSAELQRTSAAASANLAALPAQVIDGAHVVDQILATLPSTTAPTASTAATPQSLGTLIQADLAQASQTLRGLAASEHGIGRTLLVQSALGDLARDASQQAHAFNAPATASVWAMADAGNAQYRPDGYAVTDYRQRGQRIGVDLPAGDNGQLWQLSLGKQDLEGHNSDGSRFESSQHRLAASLHQPLSLGWFAAQLGVTGGQVVSERQQWANQQAESLHSRYDQRLLAARLEAGVYLPHGLAPYLAVGALHQRQDGFAETSDSGLGLSADAASTTVSFIEPGLRLQRRTGAWIHDATLSWRHLPGHRRLQLDASLDGLPSVSLKTAATTLPTNTMQLSLGTAWQLSARVQAFGRLSWEKASDFDDAVNASVGLHVGF